MARLDGKFVVHSNDDTLSAEDMALGYKQLQRVEEAWRTLKSGLKLRPVYHWAPPPDPRPCCADRVRFAARADGRTGLQRHLAQHPRRSQADKTCAIVEPKRRGLTGHRADDHRCQAIEIVTDQQSPAAPRRPIITTYMGDLDDAHKALFCLDESASFPQQLSKSGASGLLHFWGVRPRRPHAKISGSFSCIWPKRR